MSSANLLSISVIVWDLLFTFLSAFTETVYSLADFMCMLSIFLLHHVMMQLCQDPLEDLEHHIVIPLVIQHINSFPSLYITLICPQP